MKYKHPIKAIFFDIDGTLVSFNTHRIPDSTQEAIDILKAKGIKVFIATGRHFLSINNLGDLSFDGYVTLNGGICLDNKQQTLYKRSIPETDIQSLVRYMKLGYSFPCIFVHEKTLYLNYANEETDKVFRMLDFPTPPILPLEEASQGEIFQLVAFFPPHQQEQIMAHMPHSEATRWTPLFSDIIPQGSSKQKGMDQLLSHFGIHLSESIAFGDGGNDISMLKHAGIGIAMGNADEKVKGFADYVTSSVDHDGIRNALIHFGLL